MNAPGPSASPDPFLLEGNDTGVLLLHGFTGAPAEMRLIGEHLHRQGLTVSGPLLPGHGTTPRDLNRYKKDDWLAAAREALAALEQRCRRLFVGGLSMGSMLSIALAADRPDLAGLIVYAPAVGVKDWRRFLAPVLGRFIPTVPKEEPYYADPETESRLWCYDVYPTLAAQQALNLLAEVKALVPRVTVPALVVYTEADPTVSSESGQYVYEKIGSADKELLILKESGHCITLDSQFQLVAERTLAFIAARL